MKSYFKTIKSKDRTELRKKIKRVINISKKNLNITKELKKLRLELKRIQAKERNNKNGIYQKIS